jgi:hypothetical protein
MSFPQKKNNLVFNSRIQSLAKKRQDFITYGLTNCGWSMAQAFHTEAPAPGDESPG